MADTFPARATSPAASNPSSAQMTAAESENAPLLSQDAAQAENTAPDADPEANTHPSDSAPLPSEKHMVILTLLSFALSLISLTFVAAAYIFVHAAPFDIHFFRGVDVSVQIVVPFTILAALLSLANLIRLRLRGVFLPMVINVIFDIVTLFYVCAASISALSYINDITCAYSDCDRTAMDAKILMGFGMAFALIVSLIHLVLFILRCIAAYRSRFWHSENRPSSFKFPTGTFTVECSIKLLRQEREGQEREGQIRI